MSKDERYALGVFRQGYQQLRESIVDNDEPKFVSFKDPRYARFDDCACKVALIISESKRPKQNSDPKEAAENLREIKNVRSEVWKKQKGRSM